MTELSHNFYMEASDAINSYSYFMKVFVAYAAEAADMIKKSFDFSTKKGKLKVKYQERLLDLPPIYQRDELPYFRFTEKKRCTFSFATDVTTMLIYKKCIHNQILDANMLFRVLVAHTLLNSQYLMSSDFIDHIQIADILAMQEKDLSIWFLNLWTSYNNCSEQESAEVGKATSEKWKLHAAFVPPSAYLQSLVTFMHQFEGGEYFCVYSGYHESMPAFLGEAAKWCGIVWGHLEPLLRENTSNFKRTTSIIYDRVRNTPWLNGDTHLLPPFLCFVYLRTMSLADYRFFDWNTSFIGKYAAVGMYMAKGNTEEVARTKSTKDLIYADFADFCTSFRSNVKKYPDVVRRQVFGPLFVAGLEPFSNQSIEHMLCEYRKVVSGKTARNRKATGYSISCQLLRCHRQISAQMLAVYLKTPLVSAQPRKGLARAVRAGMMAVTEEDFPDNGMSDELLRALKFLKGGEKWYEGKEFTEFEDGVERCMSRFVNTRRRPTTQPASPSEKNATYNDLIETIISGLEYRKQCALINSDVAKVCSLSNKRSANWDKPEERSSRPKLKH